MEEFALTTPITTPAVTTARYRVVLLVLDLELRATPTSLPGMISITLTDNTGKKNFYQYSGQTAQDFIKFLNTANLSTKSMHKRILEKLEADGLLPPGDVVGAPDGTLPQE